jgi:quinone-modifying oxidoreductase subunit QmoC
MPEPILAEPDVQFIRELIADGGGGLKKCFQCATCSAVCDMSDQAVSFPRKQMIMAQWGMRDELLKDAGVWVCHDCGDCTAHCPRDVNPARIMSAIRQQAIRNFAFPAFMGELAAKPATSILILIPAALLALLAMLPLQFTHQWSTIIPQPLLLLLLVAVTALMLCIFAVEITRFVRALRAGGAEGSILSALGPTLNEIGGHGKAATARMVDFVIRRLNPKTGAQAQYITGCKEEKRRYLAHMLVMVLVLLPLVEIPLPVLHPLKLFINVCGLAGVTIFIVNRLRPEVRAKSTPFDWSLLVLLESIFLTGLLFEVVRPLNLEPLMYGFYFAHFTFIFALLLYAPYSKLAHALYRTVAMAATWEKQQRLLHAALVPEHSSESHTTCVSCGTPGKDGISYS